MGTDALTGLFGKVLENSLLFGILVFIGWILWKRYVQHIDKTERKLDEYEKKMDEYMTVDRKVSNDLIKENTEAFNECVNTNRETHRLLQCFIKDMQEFKKSKIYQLYRQDQQTG